MTKHSSLLLLAALFACLSASPQRHISSAADLRLVATESQTNNFAGQILVIDCDIDLEEQPWLPIGNADFPFQGELNGCNHTIRNLYIVEATGAAGLFAETGEQAEIHHLALSKGQIFTNNTSNIGSFVGIHRGELHHCFNMVRITAQKGDSIGGLVGTNHGTIRYVYNTGIVTDANDMVGGLVGKNKSTAILRQCYNTGYCLGSKHIGSLFGENEVGSTLDHVYFDQQVTRMHATGFGSTDPSLNNNNHAVAKTEDMLTIFGEDIEWDTTFVASYPQLSCFAGTNTSKLSVYGILLDAENQPIERADGVGAPTSDDNPRESFSLCKVDGTIVAWDSPNDNVIQIQNETTAKVLRPCGNQQVILTVSLNQDTKEIYTQVKGYDTFDPGKLDGGIFACLREEGITLSGHGKEPTGGKDDEQNGEKAYQYLIFRDSVAYDVDSNEILVRLDTIQLSYPEYQNWSVPTSSAGTYILTQRVHDYQCQTDFVDSEGAVRLIVREQFDPGKLFQKPDTIYGIPVDTVVLSEQDATGGGGQFDYLWTYTQLRVDYATGAIDTIAKGTVRQGFDEVRTATCPVRLTAAGEYIYTRVARDATCTNGFQPSDVEHRIVVYAELKAGSISPHYEESCMPTSDEVVRQASAPSGGNGIYTYRWLCNDQVISDMEGAELPLTGFPMEAGQTYVFYREVKDGTGYSDWTRSGGTFTIKVYSPYDAGALKPTNRFICLEPTDSKEVELTATEARAVSGDGDFVYSWLLYRASTDTILLDTLREDISTLYYSLALEDYSLSLPTKLLLRRTVQNSRCQTQWQDSEGEVVYTIGVHRYDTINIPICALELPYIGTYVYSDNHTDNYTIHKDGDIIERSDLTKEGCPHDITLIGRAIYEPEVEVQPVVSACQTDTTLLLTFRVLQGSPDHYDLDFNEEALAVGFQPIAGGEIVDDNEIAIPIPTTQIGQYGLRIRFYTATVGESECKGPEMEVRFSLDIAGYVHRKWNDVVFVDNSDKNCEPNCEEDLTFVAWQWYRDGVVLPGATGQYYYEQGGLNGFYYVEMTTEDGTVYRSCQYEIRPTQALDNVEESRLRIYPVPTFSGSELHVEAEEAGRLQLYTYEGTCCGDYRSQDGNYTLTAPAVPGIYLVRWIGSHQRCATRKLIVL